jgi:hypothetical protein
MLLSVDPQKVGASQAIAQIQSSQKIYCKEVTVHVQNG